MLELYPAIHKRMVTKASEKEVSLRQLVVFLQEPLLLMK
jgi:hypothetical protein